MQDTKPNLSDIEIPATVTEALRQWWNSGVNANTRDCSSSEARRRSDTATEAVKVALLSLATNPVPATGDAEVDMWSDCEEVGVECREAMRFGAREWQRRAFICKPDPVPEEVKAMLIPTIDDDGNFNARILKAFALGKAHSNDTL